MTRQDQATIKHAFAVFTKGIRSWWPPENPILTAELAESSSRVRAVASDDCGVAASVR
jgi:hypothetical protein